MNGESRPNPRRDSFAFPGNGVGTRPLEIRQWFRSGLAQGLALDTVLRESRFAGASLNDCIMATSQVCGCELGEAAKWIHDSMAWADVVAGATLAKDSAATPKQPITRG